MPSDQDIIQWINAIKPHESRDTCRKRARPIGLISPPQEAMSRTSSKPPSSSTPQKKRRLGREFEDELGSDDELAVEILDATPKAHHRAPSPSRSATSSSVSQHSAASSPRKQMLSLAIQPHAIVRRVLEPSAIGLPDALRSMLSVMEDVSEGVGVIASTEKYALDQAAANRSWHSPKAFRDFVYDNDRSKLGHTPPIHAVESIVAEAAWCIETDQVEASWNCAVHYPLLNLALHEDVRLRRRQLVDSSPCTTASILPGYEPGNARRKMVDFVIVIRPELSPAQLDTPASTRARLNRLRSTYPSSSINHTGLNALLATPIAVSIETKRPVADKADHAELQMSTWLAAHWKKLDKLVELAQHGSNTGTNTSEPCAQLPFLPAVIVQGHEWRFVACTREGIEATFWADKCFGSTENVLGVYKIVFGLQVLARWTREVFDPWFQQNILSAIN